MSVLLLATLISLSPAKELQFERSIEVEGRSLDVHVTDKQGRFVTGLGLDDFELLEDGEPQRIDGVREIHHPRPAPADSQVSDSTLLERWGTLQASELPTRHFVFAYDQISGVSPRASRDTMRWAAENLLPEDRVTIVTLGGRLDVVVENQPYGEHLLPLFLQAGGRRHRRWCATRAEYVHSIRGFMHALEALARRLEGRRGRKAVLLISDAGALNPRTNDLETQFSVRGQLRRQVVRRFLAADVTVHAIESAPLYPSRYFASEFLHVLSDLTGGTHVFNTNNFRGALDRIQDGFSSYYRIEYTSRHRPKPGSFPRIKLKLKPKGLTAQHKPRYHVPKAYANMTREDRKYGLVALVQGASAGNQLSLTTRLIHVPLGEGKVWLGVVVDFPREIVGIVGTRRALDFQIVAEVQTPLGSPLARVGHLLELDAASLASVEHSGLVYIGGVELPRLEGQVRLVVRDELRGLATSVDHVFDLREPFQPPLLVHETERLHAGNRETRPPGVLEFRGQRLGLETSGSVTAGSEIDVLLAIPDELGPHAASLALALVDLNGQRRAVTIESRSRESHADRVSVLLHATIPSTPPGPCLLEATLSSEDASRTASLPLVCQVN